VGGMGIEKLHIFQTFNIDGLKFFSSNLKFNEGDFLEIFLRLLSESAETSNDTKTPEKFDGNSLFSKQAILPINLLFSNTQVEYDGENISWKNEKNLSNFPDDIPKLNIPLTNNPVFLASNTNLDGNNKYFQISAKNGKLGFIHKSFREGHIPTQIDNYILNQQGDIKISKNLDLKDSNIEQYKNESRAVYHESFFYNSNFKTETLTSKGKSERKEYKSGEINHSVQIEIKELPRERIKVQESEKSLRLKDFRIFEKDGEKKVTVKFKELGFEIRFLQDTAKLKFTLNQQLANFITSYDVVRISQIFQSLGVKLESVSINGQEIYGRDKNKDRGNIRLDESTHKNNNTSGCNSSFSVFL